MKGSEANLLELMEGGKNHFVIPVYQRKYDWKTENCRQLYEDLKKVVRSHRSSHFFGSIVCSVQGNGSQVEYYVIDGQQRLTTVSLLLLALRNLLAQHKISSGNADLCEEIQDCYLISKYSHDGDKFKMRLLKGDREAFKLLFGDEQDFDLTSNLTHNYQFFCDVLLKQEVPVDELYSAIGKLSVISITLDADDNAQLIFESLNSTGLALDEGDKICNLFLLNLFFILLSRYFCTSCPVSPSGCLLDTPFYLFGHFSNRLAQLQYTLDNGLFLLLSAQLLDLNILYNCCNLLTT